MTAPGFRPTHVVPRHGMPAWETPDPARPTVPLDPLLPVQLVERRGDWGHVVCANGWSAWVDGRYLVAVPDDPPAAGGPLAGADDPRPLLARAEQALARYRGAVEELAAGTLDGESFRGRTRGLRIGVVVDGESLWLYDTEHGRWVHADGRRLSTYAADEEPRAAAHPGHAPTQVVTPDGP
ncbi:SH3 domain-containing protein [Streptomyces sp. 7R007]